MKFFLVAGLAVSGSLANFFEASILEKRDLAPCSDSYLTDCGSGCIGYLETCCPDKSGGCPVSSVCWLGNNGKYGCCPIGEICDGPGGAITSTIGSPGGTSTVSIPEQPPTTTSTTTTTTTTTEPPATTEAPPSTTEAPPTTTEAPQPTTTEQSSVSLPILTVPSGTAPTSAPAPATSSPPIVAGAATLGLSASTLLGGVLAGVLVLFF